MGQRLLDVDGGDANVAPNRFGIGFGMSQASELVHRLFDPLRSGLGLGFRVMRDWICSTSFEIEFELRRISLRHLRRNGREASLFHRGWRRNIG